MEIIRTYEKGSKEYERLQTASEILTKLSPKGRKYYVGDTYFDYGQNWKWTTILCDSEHGTAQALCPRDYKKLLTYKYLSKAIAEIVSDEWWTDCKED